MCSSPQSTIINTAVASYHSGYWEDEESVNNSHLGALYSVLPYSHSGIVGGTIRMFLLVTFLLCLVGGLRGAVTFPSTSDDSPCVVLEQCCPLWQLWESRHIRVDTSSSVTTLSSYICGWEGDTPLYSCPGQHQPRPGEGQLPCTPWLLEVIQGFMNN